MLVLRSRDVGLAREAAGCVLRCSRLRVYKRLVSTLDNPGGADRWALRSHVTCFDIRKVSDFAPFRREANKKWLQSNAIITNEKGVFCAPD